MLSSICLSLFLAVVTLLSASHLSSAEARVFDAVAIMHQPSSNNICALTFDDGPASFTEQLLDSLREEGVHATFFLLGQQIKRRPEVVQRMASEGHEVASHGYSHPNMRKLGKDARYYELNETNVLLAELGVEPRFFRPPYGKYDPALASMALELGMSTVMWTTDSRDWKRRPDYRNMPTAMGRRLQPEEMRGIFLFHDTKQATVQDVHRIVQELREGGCQRFVTVSEYFAAMDTEEPLMTARPEIPERELQDKHGSPVRSANAALTEPHSPEPAAASNTVTATTAQGEQTSGQMAEQMTGHEGGGIVPLARSSTPWFLPKLFRSGS